MSQNADILTSVLFTPCAHYTLLSVVSVGHASWGCASRQVFGGQAEIQGGKGIAKSIRCPTRSGG